MTTCKVGEQHDVPLREFLSEQVALRDATCMLELRS
jgi:hypothetical protein